MIYLTYIKWKGGLKVEGAQREYQVFLVSKEGKETHVQDITNNQLIRQLDIKELQK